MKNSGSFIEGKALESIEMSSTNTKIKPRSPLQRMKSLRSNKKGKSLKATSAETDPGTESIPSPRWARNPGKVDEVLKGIKDELSPGQLDSLGKTLSTLDNVAPQAGIGKKKPKNSFFKGHKAKNNAFLQICLHEIEISEPLGYGASSAGVFVVIVDGWSCAMKRLKWEHVATIDIQCFEREMDILYQLPPHENIVRYLFHTKVGAELCLFMQLYSGTLRELLDEKRAQNQFIPVDQAQRIALNIAKGIQFLHQHGVIHRDIKAGNIFTTKNEDGGITRVAIGDFDTSLRVSASIKNFKDPDSDLINHDEALSSVGNTRMENMNTAQKRKHFAKARPCSTVGTTGFMAPEVLNSRGSTPYGFKADIFSFGMVLYELITLEMPFEEMEQMDILEAVMAGTHTDLVRPSKEIEKRYPILTSLFYKCTSANPQERPGFANIIKAINSKAPNLQVTRKASFIDQLNHLDESGRHHTVDAINLDSNEFPSVPIKRRSMSMAHMNEDLIFSEEEDTEETPGGSDIKKSKKNGIQSIFTRTRHRKERKERKGKDDKKKKASRKIPGRKTSDVSEVLKEEEVLVIKRPKRNTISKSTMLEPLSDGDTPLPELPELEKTAPPSIRFAVDFDEQFNPGS